ncbi:MAG TPA: S9 family peptidase [Allosphingosinicella sp.]|nr:S9 family peptidase [Allosphingosinicella sp.]
MRAIALALLLTTSTAVAQPRPPAPGVAAEAAPLIPRALLFGNATQNRAKISPDGRRLAWLAPRDGVMNIWVAPTDDRAGARAVTGERQAINNYWWSPDGRYLLFGQDAGGNENFRVYAVDAATGGRHALSPEGANVRADVVATSPLRPDIVLIANNQRDPELFDLFEVDYRTGAARLVYRNPGFASIAVDRQLRPRIGMRAIEGGRVGYFVPQGAGEWRQAFSMSREDNRSARIVGFNRAGTTAYMIDAEGRDKAALVRLDPETGVRTLLAASEVADVEEVLTDPRTFEPIAYAANHQLSVWHPVGAAFRRDVAFLRRSFPGRTEFLFSSDLDDSSATADGGRMIVWVVRADRSPAYHLYDRRRRRLETLFSTRPELDRSPLQPMQTLVLRSRDGLPLVSYLTLPPGSDRDGDGRPEQPVPLILQVHGGPWARDYHGYESMHQWLANRGYAVLSVNYRGSTGFGKAFAAAATHQFAGRMHDDLIDGVDWAIARGITSRDRVAIMGTSYGGYATLVGLTFTPDRFRCGVDIVGPSSLATLIESFPPYWRPRLELSWYRFVGNPAVPADRERMLAQSPITRVAAIRAPLLIGQGGNDPRVTKAESDRMVAAMRARGLPVTYLNFPDEGHGFNRPENRMGFYAVTENFLAQCLGGRAEPIGADLAASSAQVLEGAAHVPGLREAAARR